MPLISSVDRGAIIGFSPLLAQKSRIAAIPGVGATSLVRSGNGFLTETHDRDGNLVDRARSGYVYPVEVNSYADLDVHSAFVSEDIAARFAGLRDDTVMLGETSARVRRLTPGATLTFESGVTVTIAGWVASWKMLPPEPAAQGPAATVVLHKYLPPPKMPPPVPAQELLIKVQLISELSNAPPPLLPLAVLPSRLQFIKLPLTHPPPYP